MREFVSGWGNLGGIAAVQCLVQVTYMISWCAANHASLVVAGRGSCAGSLRLLVWGLRGVSMERVLMERSDWIHFVGSLNSSNRRSKCKLNKGGELETGVGENLGKATQGSERRSIWVGTRYIFP